MAHEIEELDGADYALQPAWHGLGTVIDHLMTADEASAAAGLYWEVGLEPVYDRYGQEIGGHKADLRWSVRLDLDDRRYDGLVKKVCGGACSTISPRSMKITRSATDLAKPISWVTHSMVMPDCAR